MLRTFFGVMQRLGIGFFLALCCTAFNSLGQGTPIMMDGVFDDWSSVPGWSDPTGPEGAVDLLEMKAAHDEDYLYVYLRLGSDIDLTDGLYPHDLFLYIDADANAETGYTAQAGFGSELGIKFTGLFAFYDVVPASTVNFSEIGFHPAPTVTGHEFELALRRDAVPDGVNPLFPQDTLRLLLKEAAGGDVLPDAGMQAEYVFTEVDVPAVEPLGLERPALPVVRTCAYNVLANGLTNANRQPRFERIIKAIDADVFLFSECNNTTASAVADLLNDWLPLGTASGWHTHKDGDLITASIWPHLQAWNGLSRQTPVLVDVPVESGGPILFINSHLSCCANDAGRQDQVDEMVAWVLEQTGAGGSVPTNTPIVYAGDLNLVGYAQQLETLLHGEIVDTDQYGEGSAPDWDGTSWADALPRHTDARLTYTWRSDGDGIFPPGRLDFLLYSDAVLSVEQAFVLRTEGMPADRLLTYGLLELDAALASDHYPVVADVMSLALAELDLDEDGLLDSEEVALGTDPADPDTDGDGLSDGLEVEAGQTDPLLWDSNENGCSDGEEALGLCAVCIGDLNGDNQVNVSDLVMLLGNFGGGCL